MSDSAVDRAPSGSAGTDAIRRLSGAPIAVEIRGASKRYPNGLRALEPLDLQVREGEFATLVGPSGCGKSTLLRMVAGLLAPSTGGITLWPADAVVPDQRLKGNARAPQPLAFVFQSATLMPWASVEHNVRLPLDLARIPERDAVQRVAAALALVGLDEFPESLPRELSGGMQMRVSIARALVTEPRLLLLDEPFGALDEITRNRLDRDVRDLWAQRSLTVLFVTHSIYEAVFLSTRIIVMSARPGRIAGEMTIDEPHPRTDEFRTSDRFVHWCAQLSQLLVTSAGAAA